MNIKQNIEPIKVDKDFDIMIYQFLYHSSNSLVYGILALSLFISTILLSKAFTVTEKISQTLNNGIILTLSIIVGLLWWRWSINRQDSKMYIQALLLTQKEDKEYAEKAEFLVEVIKSYKRTTLERLRTIRLYFGLLTSIYLFLTTLVYGNALFDTSINIFDNENILYLIIGVGSLITFLILSLTIKIKYDKGLIEL